jgi:hypothetical protein
MIDSKIEYKVCSICGGSFSPRKKEGTRDWSIRKFCSLKCGYMGRKTNSGRVFPKEVRDRISMARKKLYSSGMVHPWLGRKHTDESKIKMRNSHPLVKGINHPMFGRNHSDESKIKISINRKGKCVGDTNIRWLGGVSFIPYTIDFNNKIKEQIRERDNHKCQICGVLESECKSKLCVHHIDYDKFNTMEYNLISLCMMCHLRTNLNREYWCILLDNIMESKGYFQLRVVRQ